MCSNYGKIKRRGALAPRGLSVKAIEEGTSHQNNTKEKTNS
jgi:hypothetical protein